MAQTTINVRMDTELKKEIEKIFEQMGLNTTTAFNIFARAVVQKRKIPFEISAPNEEDFAYPPTPEMLEKMRKYATKKEYIEAMLDEADEELENNPELYDADKLFVEMRKMINGYKKI